jgi:hypothetical protein
MRTLASVVLLVVAAPALSEELRYDFRDGTFDPRLFRYEGPTPREFITPEVEGLRWRFPAGSAPARPVGLYWRTVVRGNFRVTARYEIIEADRPDHGPGAGVELYLMLDTERKDAVAFARTAGRTTFLHLANNEAGKRRARASRSLPATPAGERGRLRLAREGRTVVASLAEGDRQHFTEVHRADVGAAAVRMVRFAGTSGGDANAGLDMRLLTFELQTQDPGRPPEPAPTEAPEDARGGGGVFWALGTAGAVVLAAGLILCLRRPASGSAVRRASDKGTKGPHLRAGLTGKPGSVVRCAHCGRGLKVGADVAGKKVRCPACGSATAVPTSTLSPAGDTPNSLTKANTLPRPESRKSPAP